MNDLKNLGEKVSYLLPKLKRYLPALFVLLLVALYGFLVYRVNVLNSAEPSATVTTQQQTASVPHVDPNLVTQLQSLQDNSTSVKALFNQARDNPFQE